MEIKILNSKEEVEDLLPNSTLYLLLETSMLLEALYEQQRNQHTDVPPELDIDTIISKKDKYALSEFIWEDTEFDDIKEQGPILVKIEKDSKLIDTFLNDWQQFNCGIFIIPHKQAHPSSSFKIITDHLRTILMVYIEGTGKVRFRLQEPRKLAGVLSSIDKSKAGELLGPIEKLYWIENCAEKQITYQAFSAINKGVYQGEFQFSKLEKGKMDDFELRFFKCEVIHEVLHTVSKKPNAYERLENISKEEWPDILDRGFRNAMKFGFLGKEVIHTFLTYSLYYYDVMRKPEAIAIYQDTQSSDHLRMLKIKALIKKEDKGEMIL